MQKGWSHRVVLGGIGFIAAILRLGWPDSSPPGIHIDEASNAWNARCLLENGTDEFGQRWPIFYTTAFGDNRSPLYLYLLMPFQAMLGMNAYSTRLPAAIGGTLAVLLLYAVMKRLFDSPTALIAAALLAIDPWHLFLTRWGHEGSIGPFLVLASLAAILRAHAKPSTWRGLLAGLLTGIACYGYAAIRIYLPVLLIAVFLVESRYLRDLWRDENHRKMLVGFSIGLGLLFSPLAWKHLTDSAINHRGEMSWVWDKTDTLPTRIGKIAARYPAHFGPDFLFLNGSSDPAQAPPRGFGAAHWYSLPLLLCGVAYLVSRAKATHAARFILITLVVYPAADLLNIHNGVNTLRSFPGMWVLPAIAAIGMVASCRWLRKTRPKQCRIAVASLAIWIVATQAVFLYRYFGEFNQSVEMARVRGLAVKEACNWLSPRLDGYGAVLWTQRDLSFIYAQTLVYWNYSPRRWFSEPVETLDSVGSAYAGALLVTRYGKQWFAYTPAVRELAIREVRSSERIATLACVVRPGEMEEGANARRQHIILDPSGSPVFEIFEVQLAGGP